MPGLEVWSCQAKERIFEVPSVDRRDHGASVILQGGNVALTLCLGLGSGIVSNLSSGMGAQEELV